MSFLDRDPQMQELLGLSPSGVPASPPALSGVLPGGAGGEQALVGEPYEAASRFDRDLMLWNPSGRSADADISSNKYLMDARIRDNVRNDAFSASGAEIHKDNVVGDMFFVNAKPKFKILGMDEVWAEEFQEEAEELFTLWAESPNNWVDAQRINTLTSLTRLAVGMHSIAGEVLATGEYILGGGRPMSTAILMIDPNRLSTPPYKRDGPGMKMGVEKDIYGAPIAYHIRVAHPGDFAMGGYTWNRVPVRKRWGRQQVIHLFEQNRPDQSRGVARMVAALKEAKITKKFRDIVLQNAVVNATFAATIESDLPSEVIFNALGGGQFDANAVQRAVAGFAGGYMGVMEEYITASDSLHLDGVKIPHLIPGSKLQMRPAASGGPLGQDFEKSLLRYIAACLGVSYEQLSKDYSETNYSSARAAMNETNKAMKVIKRLIADRFASHIYMLWMEEAFAKGMITSLSRKSPNFWEGLNREAYCNCQWIGASMGQIDELKETQAAVLRLKYNITTHEQEIARQGGDYRQVFRQKGREKVMMEDEDIPLTVDDNMMNAASGDARESDAKTEKKDGSGKKANA